MEADAFFRASFFFFKVNSETKEISRRPFAPFTAAINAFKKMDEQTKWVVREDGADSLKNKIAELEKTMSLEKEQYENEIELLKYEKQVRL